MPVSSYQSVFDLLDIQPPNSAEAQQMIEAWEHQHGRRLPEAVRQWYLIENVVSLQDMQEEQWDQHDMAGQLWYDYSNADWPESLEYVLLQFAQEDDEDQHSSVPARIRVLVENQAVCSWFIQPNGSDDPPVVVDETYNYRPDDPEGSRILEWVKVADHFSAFVFDWIAGYYFRNYTPLSERAYDSKRRTRPAREKLYLNGLWLYAANAEALLPPYLDFLIEEFSADSRVQVAEGVTQYQFHSDQGRIRVTADDDPQENGVSAWWLHAASEENLFQLAKKVLWCSDLGRHLRHWTKTARPVRDRLREEYRG